MAIGGQEVGPFIGVLGLPRTAPPGPVGPLLRQQHLVNGRTALYTANCAECSPWPFLSATGNTGHLGLGAQNWVQNPHNRAR